MVGVVVEKELGVIVEIESEDFVVEVEGIYS